MSGKFREISMELLCQSKPLDAGVPGLRRGLERNGAGVFPGEGARSDAGEIPSPGMTRYLYRWNRQGRKGQVCCVTARGTMNSCLVVFEDGYSMVTSRNAIKKVEPLPKMANGAIDSGVPSPG